MKQFTVNTPSGPYVVCCGRGMLGRVGALLSSLEDTSSVFLISSPPVHAHWGRKLETSLRAHGFRRTIAFDDSEAKKTMATVERLCSALAREGADRRSVIVALGGGVVGDVAGYVAASYARGIRIVHVPSTLVAQVDSSIGGKTGVNLPEGKNLVGAFYQPRLVVTDPQLLKTLPAREFRAGLYEVVKYGVISDELLFGFLERRMDDLLRQRPAALNWVLERCIRAKAEIVSLDERESGLRQVLNFGHTVGHALEAATAYRKFLHGEAVGWGMIAAAQISVEMNLLDAGVADRVRRLVLGVGPLPAWPRISAARLLQRMRADKKTIGGKLRMVLARGIGKVETVSDLPEATVLRVLTDLAESAAKEAHGGSR